MLFVHILKKMVSNYIIKAFYIMIKSAAIDGCLPPARYWAYVFMYTLLLSLSLSLSLVHPTREVSLVPFIIETTESQRCYLMARRMGQIWDSNPVLLDSNYSIMVSFTFSHGNLCLWSFIQ